MPKPTSGPKESRISENQRQDFPRHVEHMVVGSLIAGCGQLDMKNSDSSEQCPEMIVVERERERESSRTDHMSSNRPFIPAGVSSWLQPFPLSLFSVFDHRLRKQRALRWMEKFRWSHITNFDRRQRLCLTTGEWLRLVPFLAPKCPPLGTGELAEAEVGNSKWEARGIVARRSTERPSLECSERSPFSVTTLLGNLRAINPAENVWS